MQVQSHPNCVIIMLDEFPSPKFSKNILEYFKGLFHVSSKSLKELEHNKTKPKVLL